MPNVLIRGSSRVGLMDNMRYHVISVTSRCRFTMSLSQVPHALSTQLPAWRKVRKQSLLPCLRVLCTSIFTELTSWYLREHAALDLTHRYYQSFFYKTTCTINEDSHHQYESSWNDLKEKQVHILTTKWSPLSHGSTPSSPAMFMVSNDCL